MLEGIEERFREALPPCERATLRVVHARSETITVRRDVVQPVASDDDLGAMLTVHDRGGVGYAASADLGASGLRRAALRAREWAHATAAIGVPRAADAPAPVARACYESRVQEPWRSVPLRARIDRVREACAALRVDPLIVEWSALTYHGEEDVLLLSTEGARIEQRFRFVVPDLRASANRGSETQTRTLGGGARGGQGGLEVLRHSGFQSDGPRIGEEARALLDAPECPSGRTDLLLAPDQMYIQIHESIGHPLELDRILGDERNYAGTSFVTPEMFGSYRYGSELLDVTFDPGHPEQLASYAYDDEGTPAERAYVIRRGILLRPLGSALSQRRADLPGTANARACGWNRPPIDRMANLNVEPGQSPFASLVRGIERGVYMESNRSWSIDDSRNKFQFGCELGRLIRDGELGPVVRNPSYRGVSAVFWRSLAGVGDRDTWQMLGSPNCGKGEPNQAIRVGHASPTCWFRDVDVFGREP
jgi:predicted Zn-dependent protease